VLKDSRSDGILKDVMSAIIKYNLLTERSIFKIKTHLTSRKEMKAKKANVIEMDVREKKSEGKRKMGIFNPRTQVCHTRKQEYNLIIISNTIIINIASCYSTYLQFTTTSNLVRRNCFFQIPTSLTPKNRYYIG